jgi:hypothetical protein
LSAVGFFLTEVPGGAGFLARRRCSWLVAGLTVLMIGASAPRVPASDACDAALVSGPAQQTFPEYQLEVAQFEGSIAVLRLVRRGGRYVRRCAAYGRDCVLHVGDG